MFFLRKVHYICRVVFGKDCQGKRICIVGRVGVSDVCGGSVGRMCLECRVCLWWKCRVRAHKSKDHNNNILYF